jgi:hypothetical protein
MVRSISQSGRRQALWGCALPRVISFS